MEEQKKRILSGIQPTGTFTLGNYVGAVRNWDALQSDYNCIYMIANMHAITVPPDAGGCGAAAGLRHRPGQERAVRTEPCARSCGAVVGALLQHALRRADAYAPV